MAGHEFSNPIIPGFHPDPTICRVGEDYWLAVSSFEYFPGLPIFHSRDLVNWRLAGHALDRSSQLDLSARKSSQGIYAPTLRFHEGTFHLVATDVGGIGNFLMTARDPAGEWSDPVRIQDGPGFTWFDPSLFFDVDGRVFYTRRHEFHIAQGELDVTTGRLLSPLRRIAGPFTSDDVEAPHLYRIDNTYYLLCAEGGTGWGHAVTVGRSQSPWGPFAPCPKNPILSHRHLTNHTIRSTGHGDLVEAHDGTWWMVFLATRHREECGFAFHHLGRESFLAPVTWEDGWPVVNRGNPIQYTLPGPSLPRGAVAPSACRDSFVPGALDPRWTWRHRIPAGAHALQAGGGLLLHGQAASLNDCGPLAFVGRRIEQPVFTVRTRMRFNPQRDGEEAGLSLFLAQDFHAEIAVQRKGGANRLLVRRRAADLAAVVIEVSLPGEDLVLQIQGDWQGFTLEGLLPGGHMLARHHADRRLLCTEVAMGWVGLFAGLYATTNGQSGTCTAEFDWFEQVYS